jgi:hypothetical protein
VYEISPLGQVSLFSHFPGATPSGHLDLAFDPDSQHGRFLYAALDLPAGRRGVGGLFRLDPSGQAVRFAPDITSAWSVAFPLEAAFGGDFFVCGRAGEDPHNALWRVSRNGQITLFASATIGTELQVLAFAPDGAMVVPEASFGHQQVAIHRITRHASVDIRPGSGPNPLNLRSRGVLPVALVGSPTMDVHYVDRESVRLLNVPAIRNHYEDVAAPPANSNDCDGRTNPPDGSVDLVLHFETEQIVAALLDKYESVGENAILSLTLTGKCTDQTPFEGTDCVVLRGNPPPIEGNRPTRGAGQTGEACRLKCERSSGQFTLSHAGELGAVFIIEASTNMQSWTPLVVLTNTEGRVEFTDPNQATFRQRFYRVILAE